MQPATKMHHAKSESESTSLDAAMSTPRSPRRPAYFVQSPSQHDNEKMSYSSSPLGSPHHHPYHCSPVHHSRESSSSRFSASFKTHRHAGAAATVPWKKLGFSVDADGGDEDGGSPPHPARFYAVCFVLSFVVLFAVFSVILWAAAAPYAPEVSVKGILFKSFVVQAGMDGTGVPTRMLSLNATVRILYRNPAGFFGVHVSATPFYLYHDQLKIASGFMKNFYQPRKSRRVVTVAVQASQVAVYGGLSFAADDGQDAAAVPLHLTMAIRSRAFVLGRLVKPKFYRRIRCSFVFRGSRLGKHNDLTRSCTYRD